MKTFFKNLRGGLTFGLGILIMLFIGGIVYASLSNVEEGDILTSEKWNELVGSVNDITLALDGGLASPTGSVMAFNLKECPIGWLPANGSGSIAGEDIPDLRGKFIRGLNSFENGENKLTGENSDIDGVDRVLGSPQGDAIRNITGRIYASWSVRNDIAGSEGVLFNTAFGIGAPQYANFPGVAWNIDASRQVPTGSDNRPKNIALIYCVKA